MSIPERLFRLAKGKVGEFKEYLGHAGEKQDLSPEEEARLLKFQERKKARGELEEALEAPTPYASVISPRPQNSPARPRTPEEIAGSGVPLRRAETSNALRNSAVSPVQESVAPVDPLNEHFRLLGLPEGSDFATVQAAYEKLEERCDPGRFPAGSEEAKELEDIRKRLEASYDTLRKALDPTARRFDLIEIE